MTRPVEISIHAVSPASALGAAAAGDGTGVPVPVGESAEPTEVIARQNRSTRVGEASLRYTEQFLQNTPTRMATVRESPALSVQGIPWDLGQRSDKQQGSCRRVASQ